MAVKTFGSERLLSTDINTYLANAGLVYVASATATTGSTLSISNAFSSIYDAYRIVLTDVRLSSPAWIFFQFTGTSTNYWYGRLEVPYNNTVGLGRGGSGSVASALWEIVVGSTASNGAVIELQNPNLPRQTSYSAQGTDPRGGGTFGSLFTSGIQTDSTQFTGLTLSTGVTFANITATVYGYRKA